MTRRRLSADANQDVREAKEWYAEQKEGLDLDFREREQELLAMFNQAAQDVTGDDLAERESLLRGLARR